MFLRHGLGAGATIFDILSKKNHCETTCSENSIPITWTGLGIGSEGIAWPKDSLSGLGPIVHMRGGTGVTHPLLVIQPACSDTRKPRP